MESVKHVLVPVIGPECLETIDGLSCSPISAGGGDISVMQSPDNYSNWIGRWPACLCR
jgi:hypothetical protein